MENKKKLQGKRLKEIRKILGETQESFCEWLIEHGIAGNHNEPYKQKTIAAWESGRRNVPDEIKKVLSDNVYIDGCLVQFAYLNGDTDFITHSTSVKEYEKNEAIKGNNLIEKIESEIAMCKKKINEANSAINKLVERKASYDDKCTMLKSLLELAKEREQSE